eukprot:TRINITY_DN4758_c0_g1_i2.p1 TRINITY_DN4758_c0_g1~~TRINITY_DN4758_c0_g1_i2.p1  ORF type:complete len:135 (+),score=19.73 TRINITY_DN4758_c0_g1_i2:48-452(+)
MPLPKYYCDYCEKSFNDTPTTRKKHFTSKSHKMNFKLHYDSFKDPIELLLEQSQKPPCATYTRTGHCPFNISCRYSHLSPEDHALAQQLKILSESPWTRGIKFPKMGVPPSLMPPPFQDSRYAQSSDIDWGWNI